MLVCRVIGGLYLWWVNKKHPELTKISPKPIAKFMLVMLALTLFRVICFTMSPPQAATVLDSISIPSVLGVFWEDAVFCLPLLVMRAKGVSKYYRYLAIAVSALAFASGHLAYSTVWAFITLFYVPLISYRYGKKHGLGTVIICHILFDLITLLTYKAFLP